MKTKKLMLLGGIRYLIPIIEKAHELGLYVITCDYLPNNPAHKYSDQYVNVSIIDKEAVLAVAKEFQIDGIMSFGCDPGVVSAAYVAQEMGLPFQGSYDSVSILQNKGKFRDFLVENGFNCPHAKSYDDKDAPFTDLDFFNWPVFVKPVDSAGSKGCSKVENPDDLSAAIQYALNNSSSKSFIIEDFIDFEGFHSSADPFTIDGKLVCVHFSDNLFDKKAENPYTPACNVFPSTMKREYQDYLTSEIQRLMTLLDMKTGIYNVETCVSKQGIPYIMEVSPRGSGCRTTMVQEMAFCRNEIENEIRKAVGMSLIPFEKKKIEGCWCDLILHSDLEEEGVFDHIEISSDVKTNNVRLIDIFPSPGDIIHPFSGANMTLGNIILQFKSREELDYMIDNTSSWMKIVHQ